MVILAAAVEAVAAAAVIVVAVLVYLRSGKWNGKKEASYHPLDPDSIG